MEELLQKLKERLLGAKLDDCISSGAYRDISQLITEIEQLALYNVVGQSEQLSCGRNITTCVFYKEGGKCSNLEYCRDQTT